MKYQPSVLCWAVEIKSGKISYLPYDKEAIIPFDPNSYVVGVFVQLGCEDNLKDKLSLSRMGTGGGGKSSGKK